MGKLSFLIWIFTIIFFFLLLIIGNNNTVSGIYPRWFLPIFLLNILVGVITFLIFFSRSLILIKRKYGYSPLVIGSVFILFIVLFFISQINFNIPNSQTNNQMIECYVDGKKIMASREDCQSFSIQKPTNTVQVPQVIYQQPKQQIVIPTVAIPQPPNVRCTTEYFMGSPQVVCRQSWF